MRNLFLKILIAFVLFQLNTTPLSGQEWFFQNPYPTQADLNSIDMGEDGYGWAVGEDATILKTINFGNTWSIIENSYTSDFEKVSYEDNSAGMVAYIRTNSVTIRTLDGGQTWEELTGFFNNSVRMVSSFGSGSLVVVNYDATYVSANNGDTFTENLNTLGAALSKFYDQNNGVIIDFDNKIFKTADGGQTWGDGYDFGEEIEFISYATASIVYAINEDNVFKSLDGGSSWTQIGTGVFDHNISGIATTPNDEVFVSYDNAVLMLERSLDGGQNWETIDNPLTQDDNFALDVLEDGRIWIVGENVRMVHFDENTQEWVDQISDQRDNLIAIDFHDENYGVAAGNGGEILFTSNGGDSWEKASFPDGQFVAAHRQVVTFDENNYYTAAGFHSSDQGQNWDKFSTIIGSCIYVKSNDELFLGGSNGNLRYSNDGGESWTIVFTSATTGSNKAIRTIEFADANNGFLGGFSGIYARTSDGGQTWTEELFEPTEKIEDISFVNENLGFYTFDNHRNTIYRTFDGGDTWNEITLPVSGFWYESTFINDQVGWLAGGSGSGTFILKTTDSGETWEIDFQGTSSPFRGIVSPIENEELVWAAGLNGNIVHLMPCEGTPNLSAIEGETTVCIGDTITYSAIGTDISLVNWDFPTDWAILGNLTAGTVDVIPSGTSGTLSVQGDNTCALSNILTLELTANDIPATPEITFDGTSLTCSILGQSYFWFLNGVFIDQTGGPNYWPTENGNYSVQIDDGGCASLRSDFVNVVLVSIDDLQAQSVQVFPNPASSMVTLLSPEIEINNLQLYNSSGQLVKSWSINNPKYQILDISSFEQGVYFLNIRTKKDGIYKKLIIGK